jgi:G3E family GTPase
MGGKCEFISITKLDEVDDAEVARLKEVINRIIDERSMELAIIAVDPKESAGLKVIVQPKKGAWKKEG